MMKMKMVLILIFFLIILILSYSKMNTKEINYTILGDKELFSNNIISKNFSDLIYDELNKEKTFGFYSKDFIKSDIRIVDVINCIEENDKVEDVTIQNILKRSSILLIGIGNNEINYKLSKIDEKENNEKNVYNYLDEVFNDFVDLINIIKNYSDSNLFVLGYYNDTNNKNNDKYYNYINQKIEIFCKKNKIEFLNLFEILNNNEDYLTKTNPVYITSEGNLSLFNKIYRKINKLYLHKDY